MIIPLFETTNQINGLMTMPEGWYSDQSTVFDTTHGIRVAHRWHARCSAALRRRAVVLESDQENRSRMMRLMVEHGMFMPETISLSSINIVKMIKKNIKMRLNPDISPCLWDLNHFKSSTNSRFMVIYHIFWDTIQKYKHEDLTKETVAIIISPSCLTSSPYSWKSWNNTSQPKHISMYPPVNKHRPWQSSGLEDEWNHSKLVIFSVNKLIYQMVFPILILSHSREFPLSSVSTSSSSKGSSSTCRAEGPMLQATRNGIRVIKRCQRGNT